MNIRPATPDDVPLVLPMVAKVAALHESWDPAKYGYIPNPAEMYRRWLTTRSQDPRSSFFVAEASEKPLKLAGFIVGTVEKEIPIYRLDEYGFIHDLWVDEDYRCEGVGRQLVMLTIERFKNIGCKHIRLDTAAANEPARKLFASCGFRVSVIEMLMELNP